MHFFHLARGREAVTVFTQGKGEARSEADQVGGKFKQRVEKVKRALEGATPLEAMRWVRSRSPGSC
jgi:hypothetical protein